MNGYEKTEARERGRCVKMPKGQRCEHCGRKPPLERHHPDYAKPREVVWLCRCCHMHEHGGNFHPKRTKQF